MARGSDGKSQLHFYYNSEFEPPLSDKPFRTQNYEYAPLSMDTDTDILPAAVKDSQILIPLHTCNDVKQNDFVCVVYGGKLRIRTVMNI